MSALWKCKKIKTKNIAYISRMPNKKYCPIPFFSAEIFSTNITKLCCVSDTKIGTTGTKFEDFWMSKTMTDIRKNMLNGKGSEHCRSCYAKEESGTKSMRQFSFDDMGYISLPYSFPTHLQLKASNICNLKCIMCSSTYSTKWNEDTDWISDMHYMEKNKTYQLEKKHLKSLIDNFLFYNPRKNKILELYGGESMLAKNFWNVLEKIPKKQVQQITFLTHTNATILGPQHLRNLVKFKESRISLSIDGIEDVFEFVRFPGKWSKTHDIIQKYLIFKKNFSNVHITITFTLTSFSAIGLKDFIQYCRYYNILYHINVADIAFSKQSLGICRDVYTHPAALPSVLKDKILEDLKQMKDENTLQIVKSAFSQTLDDSTYRNFPKFCTLIKKHRKVDFELLCSKYYGVMFDQIYK